MGPIRLVGEVPQFDVRQTTDDLAQIRDALLGALRNKANDPLTKVAIDPTVTALAATLCNEAAKTSISNYNSALANLRGQMASRRKEIESANLSDAQSGLRIAKNAKIRYSNAVNNQCDAYLKFANNKKVLEKKEEKGKNAAR